MTWIARYVWAWRHGGHTINRRHDPACPLCINGQDLPHRREWTR